LIKETNLSAKRIRLYYLGIMGALEKQKTKEEKIRAAQQKQLAADPTINDLMLASFKGCKVNTGQDTKNRELFVRSTFIGSRRLRRLRTRVEPCQSQDHIIRKCRRK
jgi:hypothetical protein